MTTAAIAAGPSSTVDFPSATVGDLADDGVRGAEAAEPARRVGDVEQVAGCGASVSASVGEIRTKGSSAPSALTASSVAAIGRARRGALLRFGARRALEAAKGVGDRSPDQPALPFERFGPGQQRHDDADHRQTQMP